MNTEAHTHVYQSSPALPYDGGASGPAAGGVMHREWCTMPGCYHARRVYCSAGFSAEEYARHPRKDANIRAAERRERLAALAQITVAGQTIRVVDVDGNRLVERICVETSWRGRVWISAGDAQRAARDHEDEDVRDAYAQLLGQASDIGVV